jgi:hypothetical protein
MKVISGRKLFFVYISYLRREENLGIKGGDVENMKGEIRI